MTDKILRRHEVEERLGVARATIYVWMEKGLFPRPVKLGPRAVGWRESAVSSWLAQREKAA